MKIYHYHMSQGERGIVIYKSDIKDNAVMNMLTLVSDESNYLFTEDACYNFSGHFHVDPALKDHVLHLLETVCPDYIEHLEHNQDLHCERAGYE